MKNIFDRTAADEFIQRIEKLTPTTRPLWGKMNVAQMLAHSCVSFEMTYEDKHPKPDPFMRTVLKLLVKNGVVNETPYKRSSRTAPQFLITDERVFSAEKERLVGFINRTQKLGAAHFDGKEYVSFGKLTSTEWSNLFAKHLDHHFRQFGV